MPGKATTRGKKASHLLAQTVVPLGESLKDGAGGDELERAKVTLYPFCYGTLSACLFHEKKDPGDTGGPINISLKDMLSSLGIPVPSLNSGDCNIKTQSNCCQSMGSRYIVSLRPMWSALAVFGRFPPYEDRSQMIGCWSCLDWQG
jgi:hypothetical protein